MPVPPPPIITAPDWNARPPKTPPTLARGRPARIIEHHTAGHGGGSGSPRDAAIRYARSVQNYHMDEHGWNDSGHSFIVMRSGLIVQGRWGTVTALEHGRMVVSAHCPGQNDQPGIEHEHEGAEGFTLAQWASSVRLQAWIASKCGVRATELFPHRLYVPTTCPANLVDELGKMRLAVAAVLTKYGYGVPRVPWLVTAAKLRAVVPRA